MSSAGNYTASYNVVPVTPGGTGTMGQAVVHQTGSSGWLPATTANRSSNTVSLGGIALDDFTAGGAQFRVVTSGYVPPEVVGTLSGSGSYVDVTGTAGLQRATSASVDTIGKYQSDGGVIVDLGLQTGGAVTGNATAIQGVTVSSAVATRSYILAGDGTNLRSRLQVYDFRDWGADQTGATSAVSLLRDFISTVGQNGYGYIPPPSGTIGYLIDDTIRIHDTDATSNIRGWHLFGGYTKATASTKPHFLHAVPSPYGTAAGVDSVYTPGTGDQTQVWDLGTYNTNYFDYQVTSANKEDIIGCVLVTWNATDPINLGEFLIVGVPANNKVTVYNPRTGAAGSDANDGAIYWRIYRPMFDFRGRDWTFDGFKLSTGSGAGTKKRGPFMVINQPDNGAVTNGLSVSAFTVSRTMFSSPSATRLARYGIEMARDIVPRNGHASAATNGNGDSNRYQTVQVDEFSIHECNFVGMAEIDFCHLSSNGQSKTGVLNRTSYSPSIRKGNTSGIGYGVPRTVYAPASKTYSAYGNPHVHHTDCVLGSKDLCILYGGSNSGGIKTIRNCYAESAARIVRDASAVSLIHIDSCSFSFSSTYLHKSKCIIFAQNDGPLLITGTQITQTDNLLAHVELHSSGSKTAKCAMVGCLVQGTPGWTGRRGRLTARRCGPYRFSSGDTLTFSIDGGGAQTVTITVANFSTAGAGTVDLTEVSSWQLGILLDYYLTGATAWGEWDEAPPTVQTETDGTGGSVRCTGGTGNGQTDFDTVSTWAGQAQTQLSIDTGGLLDCINGAGAGAEPISVDLDARCVIRSPYSYSGTHVAFPEGRKMYGTTHAIYNGTHAAHGGSFTAANGNNVTPLGSSVAFPTTLAVATPDPTTGVGFRMTVTDPRCKSTSIVSMPIPTNAAAVALLAAGAGGTPFVVAADGSFYWSFATAVGVPAGTETFRYEIKDPT